MSFPEQFLNAQEISPQNAYTILEGIFSEYHKAYNDERILSSKVVKPFKSRIKKKTARNFKRRVDEVSAHYKRKRDNKFRAARASQRKSDLLTQIDLQPLLDNVEANLDQFNEEQQAYFGIMKFLHAQTNAVPENLRELYQSLTQRAPEIYSDRRIMPWKGEFAEQTKGNIVVNRAQGKNLAEKMGFSSAYEANLNTLAPGTNLSVVLEQMQALGVHNKRIIEYALKKQQHDKIESLDGLNISDEAILKACNKITAEYGRDISRGSVRTGGDYCKGSPLKADMMVSIYPDPLDTLIVAMHEHGHGLENHNRALDKGHLGRVPGIAAQEVPAMWKENSVSRTMAFAKRASKILIEANGGVPHPALAPEQLYKRATRIRHSLDRKTADPMTAMNHIAHRIELGIHFIDGPEENLENFEENYPKKWQELDEKYLGHTETGPDARQHMQDMQLLKPEYGAYYIPYFIGDVARAHIEAYLRREIFPDLDQRIQSADSDAVNQWWKDNIFEPGATLTLDEIVQRATGEKPDVKYLIKQNYERYAPELLTTEVLNELGFDGDGHLLEPPPRPMGAFAKDWEHRARNGSIPSPAAA